MQHFKIAKRLVLIAFALTLVVMGLGVAVHAQSTQPEIALQVRLPGTFPCAEPGHENRYCVRDMGEYILNFYRWFVSVTGVLAVAMVVLGGFKWVTAAGSSSKIEDAKDMMNSAFGGIVLVMLSFLFLQLINPQILSLRLPLSDIGKVDFKLGEAFCAGRATVEVNPACGVRATLKGATSTGSTAHCIAEGDCLSRGQVCSISDRETGTWACQAITDACRSVGDAFCSWIDSQVISSNNPSIQAFSCVKASNGCAGGKVFPKLFTWSDTPTGVGLPEHLCGSPLGGNGASSRVSCSLAGKGQDAGSLSTPCWDQKKGSLSGDTLMSGAISTCSDSPRANEQSNGQCCGFFEKKAIDCKDTRPSKDIEVDCNYYNTLSGPYHDGGEDPDGDGLETCSTKCWMELYLDTPGREHDSAGLGI